MRVALSRRGLRVAEQFANDRKREPGPHANRGVRVAQIMNAQAIEAGRFDDGRPWLLEIVPGLALLAAGDDVRVALKTR